MTPAFLSSAWTEAVRAAAAEVDPDGDEAVEAGGDGRARAQSSSS